ncbi:MAG: glycosyltransferase family 39 protein [Cyanobacteria bacterium]|nr:glycosyltransferase family 39 protein [Cyanobacteriota bacterium]
MRSSVIASLLFGVALLLYAFHLRAAPLTADEAAFNTHGESIRAGWSPMFFRVRDDHWLQPAAVYANAALRRAGGADVSGRFASATIGAIDVALVFLIAHLVTGRTWLGVIAAAILMLTPAHRSFAQLGTSAIFPVPLVLLWLWNLLRFFKWDSLASLIAAAAVLGLSVYTDPAAPLTAAFLWMLTLIAARHRNRQRLAIASLVFVAAWLPAAYWFYRHPDTYADTFGRWVIFAAHARNPLDGIRAFFNVNTLGTRASSYWEFWNPAKLFFSTTIWVPSAMLIVAALVRVRHIPRDAATLLVGATLIVPLAGATFGRTDYLSDAAAVLPLLAIIAGLGLDQLIQLLRPRRPLEDGEGGRPGDGWDSDHLMPRT